MYCSDPGHVEHSTRSLSDPKLLVGTTIQYSCNPGFVLQGGATITCYGREPGTPVWTSGLPHCVCKWRKDERIFFHAGSMSNLFLNFFSPCHYCSWMPEMTLHVLHFRLMTDDLRAPVCALVYLICKCYANAPHQSGLSHLEEGVEIIHESCHFSRSPSNMSARHWCKSSELFWETQQDPVFPFISFFLSAEDSVSCENPGLPDNGYQILSKRLYLPGESLTFVCYQGYELIGEAAIKCILGNPSFWSGPLPLCRGKMVTNLCKWSVS